jgi:NAD(P)-dependent dehydrogenase (short-subunit alcohol dehydrogenase family)
MVVVFIEADHHRRLAAEKGLELADYYRERGKDVPLGRVGRAAEFANLACFLASDAGSYITGTATNVDGGRSPVV